MVTLACPPTAVGTANCLFAAGGGRWSRCIREVVTGSVWAGGFAPAEGTAIQATIVSMLGMTSSVGCTTSALPGVLRPRFDLRVVALEDRCHVTRCGMPGQCAEPTTCDGDAGQHEVRCCSDTAVAGWTHRGGNCTVWAGSRVSPSNGCVSSASFGDAAAACESAGGRLCTAAEAEQGCLQQTECGHDTDLLWTSDTVPARAPQHVCVLAETTNATTGAGVVMTRIGGPSRFRPVHLQAPHPRSDTNTEVQALSLFTLMAAHSVAVSGAVRTDGNSTIGTCGGCGCGSCLCPVADAAHNNDSITYLNAAALVDHYGSHPAAGSGWVLLELHGMATSSCSGIDLFISPGRETAFEPPTLQALQGNLTVALPAYTTRTPAANYVPGGNLTCHLTGGGSTAGRRVNGVAAPDTCVDYASPADIAGRFVHVEQKFQLRSRFTNHVALAVAINATWPAPPSGSAPTASPTAAPAGSTTAPTIAPVGSTGSPATASGGPTAPPTAAPVRSAAPPPTAGPAGPAVSSESSGSAVGPTAVAIGVGAVVAALAVVVGAVVVVLRRRRERVPLDRGRGSTMNPEYVNPDSF